MIDYFQKLTNNTLKTQMHPDKAAVQKTRVQNTGKKSDSNEDDRFKMVTRAYKTLSDDEERRKHDANLICKTSFVVRF